MSSSIPTSAKKPCVNEAEDDFINKIKKQIRDEIVNDIIVGSVEVESWQKNCEITPGVTINLLNPETDKLQLTQSPFGYKNQTLIDKKVRNCKEVSLLRCDRHLRILAQKIVHSKYPNMYCEPYKLVVYEEGGHFELHTDTAEKDLLKSLVMNLPTDCKGGALMFNSFDPSELFEAKKINYVMFDISHPHRVTRVITGKKISLLFKVYDSPAETTWTHATTDQHCYSKITIPKSYKNVLFTYPNKEVLKDMLVSSEVDFETVYYNYDTLEPREVYANISSVGDLDLGDKEASFEDLTGDATKYLVNHWVEIGDPEEVSEEYTRTYWYTGNEGNDEEYTAEINYFVGYLVNPEPEGKAPSSSSSA